MRVWFSPCTSFQVLWLSHAPTSEPTPQSGPQDPPCPESPSRLRLQTHPHHISPGPWTCLWTHCGHTRCPRPRSGSWTHPCTHPPAMSRPCTSTAFQAPDPALQRVRSPGPWTHPCTRPSTTPQVRGTGREFYECNLSGDAGLDSDQGP